MIIYSLYSSIRRSLKRQLLLSAILVCAAILVSQVILRHFYVLPELERMAAYNDKQELLKLEGELQQQLQNLHQLLYDNMVWDDAYHAAQKRDAEWFARTYFINASFAYLGINGWYFYDNDGVPITGIDMRVEGENFNHFFSQQSSVQQNGLLITPQEVNQNNQLPVSKEEFLYIDNRLLMVVSHSIAPSTEKGRPAGTALVWRFVDREFVDRLTPLVKQDVELVLQPQAQQISDHISLHLGNKRINQINSDDSYLYLGVDNSQGDLMFLLKFPAPKKFYDDSLFDSSVTAGLIISLIVMILFYIFVNNAICNPIRQLVSAVNHVMQHQDFTYRTSIGGKSELSRLSTRLDQLFSLLHKQRQELVKRNERLEEISNTDPLTGLANRRYLNRYLKTLAEHETMRSAELSYLVIDIDYFKIYNDMYGHSQGDEALKQVAKILLNSTHSATDLVCRYGGEEFVIILQETTLEDGVKVAENLCKAVQAAGIMHEGNSINKVITISVGVASKPQSQNLDADSLFERADKALYQAKENGRNTVAAAQR